MLIRNDQITQDASWVNSGQKNDGGPIRETGSVGLECSARIGTANKCMMGASKVHKTSDAGYETPGDCRFPLPEGEIHSWRLVRTIAPSCILSNN